MVRDTYSKELCSNWFFMKITMFMVCTTSDKQVLRTFQHCTNHVENPVGKSMEQDNWVIPTENFQEQWKI